MAHARRPHYFSCGKVVHGNGYVMHRRAHGCRELTTTEARVLALPWEAVHDHLGRASGLLHLVLSRDRTGQDTPDLMRAVSLIDDVIEVLADSDPLRRLGP